jgi:hypothetical protein
VGATVVKEIQKCYSLYDNLINDSKMLPNTLNLYGMLIMLKGKLILFGKCGILFEKFNLEMFIRSQMIVQ